MFDKFKAFLLVAVTVALAAVAVPAQAAWEQFDGTVLMVSGVKPFPTLILIRRYDNYVTEVTLSTAAGLTQAQIDQCEARALHGFRSGNGNMIANLGVDMTIDGNVSLSVVSTGVPVNGTNGNRSVTLSTMTGCAIK